MLIDAHCHLHDREFFTEEQAEAMVERAKRADVQKIVCIGTSHSDSIVARDFSNSHSDVFWTYGIHPESAGKLDLSSLEKLQESLINELISSLHNVKEEDSSEEKTNNKLHRLVAIGEVGLDYHYDGYNREAQIRLFEKMLQLATNCNLPVVFHIREAFADFFPVVANFPEVKGVVHSFTDNKKVLKRILDETDFYVGVNGLATYSTLPLPPLERIMLETDAPFLAPIPHRGKQNEPAYVLNIAEWLAEKTEEKVEKVASITSGNTMSLYRLNID